MGALLPALIRLLGMSSLHKPPIVSTPSTFKSFRRTTSRPSTPRRWWRRRLLHHLLFQLCKLPKLNILRRLETRLFLLLFDNFDKLLAFVYSLLKLFRTTFQIWLHFIRIVLQFQELKVLSPNRRLMRWFRFLNPPSVSILEHKLVFGQSWGNICWSEFLCLFVVGFFDWKKIKVDV